jgi:hypothetical protein
MVHGTWHGVLRTYSVHRTYILPYMLSSILGLSLFYAVLRPHPAIYMYMEQRINGASLVLWTSRAENSAQKAVRSSGHRIHRGKKGKKRYLKMHSTNPDMQFEAECGSMISKRASTPVRAVIVRKPGLG